jgi:DNA invertase Pin-like site-specific DNA recombinase
MTGAFAEFERSMIRQRVRPGLSVIKEKLARDGKFVSKAGKVRRKLGRPGAESDKIALARRELAKGVGIGKVVTPSTGSSVRLGRMTHKPHPPDHHRTDHNLR